MLLTNAIFSSHLRALILLTFLIRCNADGDLSWDEFKDGAKNGLIKGVSKHLNNDQMKEVFNFYDHNNDKRIDFNEFVQLLIASEVYQTFDKIDKEQGTHFCITCSISMVLFAYCPDLV